MRDGRRMRRLRRMALVGGLVFGVLAVAAVILPPAFSKPSNDKVRICHATSSQKNPYNSIEVAIANNGDLQGGHLNHKGPVYPAAGWGDIIPPYEFVDAQGQDQTFPGYNWSPEGQAILQNGCAPRQEEPLQPTVACVEPRTGDGFLAHFGYENPNDSPVSDPDDNVLDPSSANGVQPTTFQPGTVEDAFQVQSGGGDVTWHLTGNTATAATSSAHCQGSITVVKVLNPRTDPGRFDLQIDEHTAGTGAAVGDGGTTGTIAVDSGRRTVGEVGAKGTKLGDYDIRIVCSIGSDVVAEGSASLLSLPVARRQSIACTITNTRKTAPAVEPVLDCVVYRSGAPSEAVWGYANPNAFAVSIPIGPANQFTPAPANRGQPLTFEPRTVTGAFSTRFDGAPSLSWTLNGKTEKADASSTRCTATLELRKVTVPADDPGLFNLLVNGQVYAVGRNGATTGPITVGVGEGTVSETAGPETDLADYDSKVECTRNGTLEVSVPGTKVDGAIGNGDTVVCTFTNTRTTPPPPGPPPAPPPLPPAPPEPPAPPLGDLAVSKRASPTTVVVGHDVTWTIVVTNRSSVAAADVNAARVSEHSFHLKLVSLRPTQGTCTGTRCDLGRLAPGASATIVAVTRATHIGHAVNVVAVDSEEQESDYHNNIAAAIVRITAPPADTVKDRVLGAAARATCRTLVVEPHVLAADATSIVRATVRNGYGQPLPGFRVVLVGTGVDRQEARTNRQGVAQFAVTPRQTGVVLIRHVRRLPAASPPLACTTLLAVHGRTTQSVTG